MKVVCISVDGNLRLSTRQYISLDKEYTVLISTEVNYLIVCDDDLKHLVPKELFKTLRDINLDKLV